jgi:hypothetical protein
MRRLLLLALITGFGGGCAATITITTTDPETGVVDKIDVTSARRTAISTRDGHHRTGLDQ